VCKRKEIHQKEINGSDRLESPSGAMKAGVPAESNRTLPSPDTPKSAIFTVPSRLTSMFEGFKSLGCSSIHSDYAYVVTVVTI